MIGLDGMLLAVAYATAITASLQAGSRAKYLLKHNEIGVKDGPLILPPTENETSPLWNLVQAFQRSVELGLVHHLDEERHGFIRQSATEKLEAGSNGHVGDHKIEPYSLSPFPKSSSQTERLDDLVDMYIEETMDSDDAETYLSTRLKGLLEGPSASIAKFSHSTKYWMTRAWYWRKSREEFDFDVLGEADDDGM